MSNRMFSKPFQWLTALPLLMVTGALAVIALGTLAGAQSPDAQWRERLFDYFQRLDPSDGDASENFHLVLIDRESIEAVGPWPWPRTVLADVVEAANGAGAKGVIVTEAVDSPDPLSPETIGEFWLSGARDEAFAEQLALLPRTDERLAEAFQGVSGSVGVSAVPPADPNRSASLLRSDIKRASWLETGANGGEFLALPAARYFYAINPQLAETARPSVSALPVDKDGVFRRTPLLWSLNEAPTPSVALEAARLALNVQTVTANARASGAHSQGRILESVDLGERSLDVSDTSSLRLYLPKRIAVPSTSASRLLNGLDSNSQLDGAVVLIGLDTELGEAVRTARGDLSRPAAHALTAAQIASGETPKRPLWTGYIEALAVMLFGAAAIMTAQRLEFWQAAGFAALISVILLLGAFAAFAFGDLLINPLPPATALFLGAFTVAGGRSIGGVLRDDNLRGSFHDTLPETAMKRLRDDAATDILKGVRRPITVLACELRIADEDLRTMETLPDEVTKLLAAASLDLRQTIIATGGAADQADGGRMYAYYNAPLEIADHPQAGCAAALRLIESMDKINADLEESSRTRGMQIHLAIGIATGPCFIGPMGHGRNNRYSAVGPAVDRASFLRSQSEFYGPAMICDETVHKETHHHFAYLELDKLKLRDEKRPVSVYALIGNPFIKSSKAFRALDDSHREFLKAYRAGDMTKAKDLLQKSKSSPGAKIALFDIYEERIAKLTARGLPEGWDGVHSAES
ncbi:adenylate/guanylate cyclase domain-containing protein [Hyphococcus flavus]|uniref:Adenylate/guanylate cyclase domain-containing protein n=1 Tax=Hyphococcus flavus TaxID=1866326 RepID=A0AAE9ZFN3_9PROT|nr:adenylate/guanylate cyclase domain-containing protein [Hyphococcus flavus]WDI32043.1 adenylate/guanylate cyclase domain-containing protein [Hyphococcus flavus]